MPGGAKMRMHVRAEGKRACGEVQNDEDGMREPVGIWQKQQEFMSGGLRRLLNDSPGSRALQQRTNKVHVCRPEWVEDELGQQLAPGPVP